MFKNIFLYLYTGITIRLLANEYKIYKDEYQVYKFVFILNLRSDSKLFSRVKQ